MPWFDVILKNSLEIFKVLSYFAKKVKIQPRRSSDLNNLKELQTNFFQNYIKPKYLLLLGLGRRIPSDSVTPASQLENDHLTSIFCFTSSLGFIFLRATGVKMNLVLHTYYLGFFYFSKILLRIDYLLCQSFEFQIWSRKELQSIN